MKLKTAIATAVVALSTSAIAQNSLFNNQDSSESISFVEVKEAGDVKVEISNDIIDKWDKQLVKDKPEEESIEQSVALSKVKEFCESNIYLFENDKAKYPNEEEALKYQENESIQGYCNRFVAVLKGKIQDKGYLVENLYSKPVKQGDLVDNLWISHDAGQHEGVIGYVKNNDVKVLTVREQTPMEPIRTIEIAPLAPLSNDLSTKESLSEGESIMDVSDEMIEKQPSNDVIKEENNQTLLQKVVDRNNLIGKTLITDKKQKGDLDMSQLIELLPAHMRSFHIRVIGEGMAVTLDFRDNRINVSVDKKNKIKIINIG